MIFGAQQVCVSLLYPPDVLGELCRVVVMDCLLLGTPIWILEGLTPRWSTLGMGSISRLVWLYLLALGSVITVNHNNGPG